jgi:hypothetical protein
MYGTRAVKKLLGGQKRRGKGRSRLRWKDNVELDLRNKEMDKSTGGNRMGISREGCQCQV